MSAEDVLCHTITSLSGGPKEQWWKRILRRTVLREVHFVLYFIWKQLSWAMVIQSPGQWLTSWLVSERYGRGQVHRWSTGRAGEVRKWMELWEQAGSRHKSKVSLSAHQKAFFSGWLPTRRWTEWFIKHFSFTTPLLHYGSPFTKAGMVAGIELYRGQGHGLVLSLIKSKIGYCCYQLPTCQKLRLGLSTIIWSDQSTHGQFPPWRA